MTAQICHYLDSKTELDEIITSRCIKGCKNCIYWSTCMRDEPGWSLDDIVEYTPGALAVIYEVRRGIFRV